jgi:hypothetical protein
MRDAPDFVMYVVMVKLHDKFAPWWHKSSYGIKAEGYATLADANKEMRIVQKIYGSKNAYVQQYGPIS